MGLFSSLHRHWKVQIMFDFDPHWYMHVLGSYPWTTKYSFLCYCSDPSPACACAAIDPSSHRSDHSIEFLNSAPVHRPIPPSVHARLDLIATRRVDPSILPI